MNNKLKTTVLKLPISERIELAEDLWGSVAKEHDSLGLSPEQIQEMERRLDEYYANPTNTLTWDEAKSRLKERIEECRSQRPRK